MIEVILHIGGEKTGSTSIQASLRNSRARLAEEGVLYPRAFGDSNHVGAYIYASEGEVDELKGQAGVIDAETSRRFRETLERDLKSELEKAGPIEKLVISNEHLSSRIRTADEVELLRSLFDKLLPEVDYHIVYFARPQWELIPSLYSTYVKTGGLRPLTYPLSDALHYKLHHLEIMRLWREIFSDARFSVGAFSTVDEEFDVVKQFGAMIDLGVEIVDVPSQNISLTAPAVELMRIFNKYVPRSVDNRFNPSRGNIQQLLEGQSGPPFEIPPSLQARVAAEFAAANAALNEMFGREVVAPRPDLVALHDMANDMSGDVEIGLGADEAVRMLAECFAAKQLQFVAAKQRAEKLSGQLQELRKGGKNAAAARPKPPAARPPTGTTGIASELDDI